MASAARAASEAALRNEIQVAKAQRAEVDAMFSETKVCLLVLTLIVLWFINYKSNRRHGVKVFETLKVLNLK